MSLVDYMVLVAVGLLAGCATVISFCRLDVR
jgi:hypothetical protein